MLIIVPSLACPFPRNMCSNRASRFIRQGTRQALLKLPMRRHQAPLPEQRDGVR